MDDIKGIKLILLGESGVGKTSLINVATGKDFESYIKSSLSSSYSQNIFEYNNKKFLYYLWDTAGQERFRSLNRIFIKGSKIIMFVFAINNQNSFDQINYWINYAKQILSDEKYIMALIANKSDLFEEQVISDDDIKNKAKEFKIKYLVTSACSDAEGFKMFLNELIKDYIELIGPEAEKELYFQLGGENNKDTNQVKGKKCC